ncbi:MAG: phenylalanine--tRNA ligase subunit alpha [Eubacteriales bacterium]|nr:phenylalanine--tRNA ligase subunit alpha [Eubacteriales bacterium]MDY3332679.1 phenylalanine--tRNA ligase subunit alpha [Gallibacter sp.]
MKEKLENILSEAKSAIESASTMENIKNIKISFLGKKGEINSISKSLGKVSPEEKKAAFTVINEVRGQIETLIENKSSELYQKERELTFKKETIDVTEPGKKVKIGVKHPVTLVIEEITGIFKSMGYTIYEGPDIDTVWNTFDALNSPETHPARDMTDTFYVDENTVLRPHTSSAEVRAEHELELPYKIVIPGRCYRCDTPDATHSHTFHQVEMMVIGEDIKMSDLKGTLDYMAKQLFGPDTKTNFRPHHFPFTEPSAEMDVSCFNCGGSGCNVCKGSGWIEILGCGMTHPNVHKAGGIDTSKYTGFAVGMGVERIAMLKYGIEDIRLLYENDMRFIEQFK